MKSPSWASLFKQQRANLQRAAEPLRQRVAKPTAGAGDWLPGLVAGAWGTRRWWLFRPAGVRFGEKLPLLVMLHGCHQDAPAFAASTRMNALAARERVLVLYPEQDRIANAQGCWNWFGGRSGQAQREAASIVAAIERVALLYAADRERVALLGLSAGASLAALLATLEPERFRAVVMHSGVPPGLADSGLAAAQAMRGRGVAAAPTTGEALPPLLVIHGDGDRIVAPANAVKAVSQWAAGATAGEPRVLRRGKRHPLHLSEFRIRGRGTVATLAIIEGMGHAWSGGSGRFGDPHGPDASAFAWRFIARQFAGKQEGPAAKAAGP